MQTVSNRWKQLHREDLLPENHVQITYRVTGSGVNDTYAASGNGMTEWSKIEDLSQSEPVLPKYALLELNQWLLDGEMEAMPNKSQYGDSKYVGAFLSNAECGFDTRPILTISWNSAVDVMVPGITVLWSNTYGEYATEFAVRIYRGNSLISENVVTGNDSTLNVILVDLQNFDKVEVEVMKWSLPFHRARIEQLFVGIIRTYDKGDLMSYSHEEFCDILSGELPRNTLTFSLDNTDSKWNPLNPEGEYKYLLEQQTITVKYGMNVDGAIEWIDGGMFFLSEWNTPSNGIEATFTAESMLTFMDTVYTGIRIGNLKEICVQAISQIDLPDDATYYIDDSLANIAVDFSDDDTEYKVSEILQMAANAGQCIMHQDRKGCLRIEPATYALSDYVISQFVAYTHPEFDISKELRAVNVNDGMSVASRNVKGVEETLNNPIITDSSVASKVAEWAMNVLRNRRTVSGEYRADTRMSAADTVAVENKFNETGNGVFITSIKYDFNGAFRASYEGRVIK